MADVRSALTTTDIHRQYGVSKRTIGRKVQTGELVPVRQIAGKTGPRLFDPADVQRVFAP